MSPDPVYVVLGHTRSGTSMLMRALIEGGMTAAYSKRREAGHSTNFRGQKVNPSGTWELQVCDKCKPYLWRAIENDIPLPQAVPIIQRCGRLDCQTTFWSQPHRYSGKLVKNILPSYEWPLVEWEGGYRAAMIWREHREAEASWNRVWGDLPGGSYPQDADEFEACFIGSWVTAPCQVSMLSYADVIAHPHRNFERMSHDGWPIDVAAAAAVPDQRFHRNRVT